MKIQKESAPFLVLADSSCRFFIYFELCCLQGCDFPREAAEQEMHKMEGIPDKEPDIQFVEFRNSALDLQLEVNVTTIEMKEKLETRLRHAIARLLHENGIQLAANPINPPM